MNKRAVNVNHSEKTFINICKLDIYYNVSRISYDQGKLVESNRLTLVETVALHCKFIL